MYKPVIPGTTMTIGLSRSSGPLLTSQSSANCPPSGVLMYSLCRIVGHYNTYYVIMTCIQPILYNSYNCDMEYSTTLLWHSRRGIRYIARHCAINSSTTIGNNFLLQRFGKFNGKVISHRRICSTAPNSKQS